ncbi:hypothetical protein KKD19_05745 [Patescibacteria group bacterium]|nr:hypothetical protein [Patescibacteria group bacterium]MCG2693168.1 hypothetical protein [Candidatus Parcubacteria bacterium]
MPEKTKQERQTEIRELKKEYFRLIEENTPWEIKNNKLINLDEEGEFEFRLTKDLIEKLKLEEWLANYEKEAKVSTGGIRGPQNVLYPWDTRFPLNQMGIILATFGKALVLKDDIKDREIHKVVSSEVRYNSREYVELISRIEAAQGIYVHRPFKNELTSIWMVSFWVFMNGYDGGEYVTSSHAISSKIATKDLDSQGSQFLPEMSLRFIDKIKGILKEAKESPDGYVIKFSAKNDPLISDDFDGFDEYTEYLKKSVAKNVNINLIKEQARNGFRLMMEAVGGCASKAMLPVFEKLGINEVFDWHNIEEDSFFHGIGKVWRKNPETNKEEFFDYSCDFCLMEVIENAGIEYDLVDKPVGYVVLITDPDTDRLVIGQVESRDRAKIVKDLGLDYIEIDKEKIFTVYNPGYSFFLIMDYYMKQLKAEGVWENHPRFIVTTTPSPKIWDEWAEYNGIKVVTTPVGIKEIAHIVKKVEKQIINDDSKDVIVRDIYGGNINLGQEPRMVFGGEESGGMITGLEDMLVTKSGRKALAMRDKSAGESSVIATALAANLFKENKIISEYLGEIFRENRIKSVYYVRDDIVYYNESEPDPIKMKDAKLKGEIKRDKTDSFYLSIALAFRNNKITIEQAREVLSEAIPDLDFGKLETVKFTGDATFFQFDDNMFVQVRRSGTDAKMRGYGGGPDKEDCKNYLDKLLHFDGERGVKYKEIIPEEYKDDIYPLVQGLYKEYLYYGM